MLMAFVTIAIAMVGYGIAKLYRYWVKTRKNGLLEPPIDLSEYYIYESIKFNFITFQFSKMVKMTQTI